MEIILLERVEKLGQMGDRVRVKNGYARNYLLPKGKALRVTAKNIERFGRERATLEADNLEKRGDAEKVAAELADSSWIMIRQASESLQLYGSVTARDIAEVISASGVPIKRQQVMLASTIKTLGTYPVRVALHPELSVEVKINVARSEEEAALQAKTPDGRLKPAEGAEAASPVAPAEADEEIQAPEETPPAVGEPKAPDAE